MANLNEDVLCHIFSFLKPLERVPVSQGNIPFHVISYLENKTRTFKLDIRDFVLRFYKISNLNPIIF